MKKGDKFYQIVQPLRPFILSGERVGLEEGEYVPIDGKQRKIDDVIWDYAEAEKYAAKLNAEEARDGRNNKAVKGIV